MDKEDLRKAMQQAQDMQIDLVKVQAELANTELNAHSTDNRVSVTMTAQGEFKNLKIDPTLLAEGLDAVEAGVLDALRNVAKEAASLTQERLSQISKNIGL